MSLRRGIRAMLQRLRGFGHRLLKNSEKEHNGGERPAQAMAHKAKPPKARDVERV
jgi:hypothetical protein